MTIASLDRLLRPRSIAIVGASDKPGALGASVLTNLERQGYAGDIHLINPKRDMIGGRACINSIADLPDGVDAAVLAIPRVAVLDTVRALAARGVGAAIIFSAGFAEGGAEGMAEQQELARIADAAGMVIEGPNCLGLVNFVDGIPLTFVELPPVKIDGGKRIGIVSQSGAMAAVLGVSLISRALPLSFSVSTGNEAASGVEDYVDYLIDHDDTRVIAMIVEQFRKPARFLDAARRARAAGKHIVLLHPGQSSAARESAATHTGAMAGDYAVMRTLVQRAGVIFAETLEELADIAEIALRCATLPQGGTAVIVESGAFKALTLDFCEQIGLSLPAIHDADSPALRATIPDFVPVSNPLDVTAQGLVDPDLYRRTIAALVDDDRFGTIIVPLIQTDPGTSRIKFPTIAAAIRDMTPAKPVIVVGLDEGAEVPAAYIDELRALGVPYFPTTERVYRAVKRLSDHAARDFATADGAPTPLPALADAGGVVPEYRAKALLGPLGIPFPQATLATTAAEALAAAEAMGWPVVLKAQSTDLSHKSDAGGVIVGLADPAALAAGWDRLAANIAHHRPGLILDGVLVEKMGERGTELIVGARNDPEWGPVILLGFGGVMAELLHDVRLVPHDLTRAAIVAELRQLKSAALFDGFRGSPALDVDAVADIVIAVGRLLAAEPAIREIDLNPVLVYPVGKGAVALDALMLVDTGG
ncbi:acetate--CoA ligase family protein [Sphingomonas sp. CFBP 8760]|uniref:acetate--CoA ligase family protein n=1 Tax=Sphingomonas sp. CFBP 8760 TaxID=2775282 RepID=UPI001786094D|nr:acetate--CoA ligase family protein [Sphingomonas sp. CFBP 8760]MBD8545157.1 acetate--CoA ligase family protein [Sphingomonas sp. CFBP 8760]